MTETIINHASSKENRAKRLRILRKMCGLTRKDFSNKYAISASNFQNWEGPRYGGLTESAAIKFIDCIRKEGIKCTLEWLMFGSGSAPVIMPSAFDISSISRHMDIPQNEPVGIPDEVQKELDQFCHNYPNALALQIHDESMTPYFQKGEILAGICYYEHQIATAIGKDCIVQLADGRKLVRRLLLQGNDEFHLIAHNLSSNHHDTLIPQAKIIKAAPIIWRRMV